MSAEVIHLFPEGHPRRYVRAVPQPEDLTNGIDLAKQRALAHAIFNEVLIDAMENYQARLARHKSNDIFSLDTPEAKARIKPGLGFLK